MTAAKKKTSPKAAPPQDEPQTAVTVTESSELVTVENLTPAQIFTAENIAKFISDVEKLKDDFLKKCDSTTKKGQAEIVTFAARIRATRKLVDEDIGKTYVAVMKDEPKRIDALRKQFRDTLDLWATQVRAPVTALEEKEEARKLAHETALADIGAQISFQAGAKITSAEIQRRIDLVAAYASREWEEFRGEYETTVKAVNEKLGDSLVTTKKAEDDAAELKRLQDDAAERKRLEGIEAARVAGIEEGKRLAAAQPAPTPAPTAAPAAVTPPPAQPSGPTSQTIGYGAGKAPRSAADEKKATVNREVLADLLKYGTTEAGAKNLIKAIATGTIRHVFIKYE